MTEVGKESVLRARGRSDGEGGIAQSWDRSAVLPLVAVAVCSLALMTLFESLQDGLNPGITRWQSNIATIAFGSAVATIVAFLVRLEMRNGAGDVGRERGDALRRVIEGAPDGIFVKDMESRYIIVNRKFVEYKGAKSDAALLGRTVFDFLPMGLATVVAAEDQELRSGRSAIVEREISAVDGHGNVKWDSTTRVPLIGADGKIMGIVGVQREITRSKLIEQKLREQETRLLAAQRSDNSEALK